MTRRTRTTARHAALALAAGAALVGIAGCGLIPTGSNAVGGVGMMGGGPMTNRAGNAGATGAASGGIMASGRSMMGSALTCTAPTDLPGARVTVSLVDMPMMSGTGDPAPLGVPMRLRTDVTNVPAGQVSFVAANLGARTHELVVLPLASGQSAGARPAGLDGEVVEVGSLGEASASCTAGSGEGITPRSAGWVTLTLAPGRYELLCNEPNHYTDGMWTELDVT